MNIKKRLEKLESLQANTIDIDDPTLTPERQYLRMLDGPTKQLQQTAQKYQMTPEEAYRFMCEGV